MSCALTTSGAISARQAEDEQHVEDVAADDVADRDVGAAAAALRPPKPPSPGALVPNATTVSPTTSGEMPNDEREPARAAHEQLGAGDEQRESDADANSCKHVGRHAASRWRTAAPTVDAARSPLQGTSRTWTRNGPCAPSTIVCSMSPVREGPEIRLIARGMPVALGADQRESLLHPRDDAVGAHDRDVRVGKQRRRGRRRGAGDVITSVPVSAIAQKQPVMPRRSSPVRGPRLDLEARARPVEVRELGPADAPVRLLRRERRRQLERVEVTRHRGGKLRERGSRSTVLCHVGRPREEAGDQVGGHRRPRALRARGDVRARRRAASSRLPDLAQRGANAREDRVARRRVVVDRRCIMPAPARGRTRRSGAMPRAIASVDAA